MAEVTYYSVLILLTLLLFSQVPEDRKDYVCSEPCDIKNILSVTEVYSKMKEDFEALDILFFRLPVNDERVPNLEDFDRWVLNYKKTV